MSATHATLEARVSAFTRSLRAMSPDDIRRHATRLDATRDELAWWRSTIDVDRRLRDAHLSRLAAVAARAARDAVLAAANRDAHGIDADVIVTVSRAAAEAARGIVAGHHLAGNDSPTTNLGSGAGPDHTATLDHPSAA